jgi:hypothetical protein
VSTLLSAGRVGPEFFGSSSKTGVRWIQRHAIEIFIINGRRHVRREDISRVIEASKVIAPPKAPISSLKAILDQVSAEVLAKRRTA